MSLEQDNATARDQLADIAELACNASERWPDNPVFARLAADAVQEWSDALDAAHQ